MEGKVYVVRVLYPYNDSYTTLGVSLSEERAKEAIDSEVERYPYDSNLWIKDIEEYDIDQVTYK